MTQTLVQSTFEEYVACGIDPEDVVNEQAKDRRDRLQRFPHAVMLKLAYHELDYAERWCWIQFGPRDGECWQHHSYYRVCADDTQHSHVGTWTSHWYTKTDYDYGFCEFSFSEPGAKSNFLQQLPEFHWNESWERMR